MAFRYPASLREFQKYRPFQVVLVSLRIHCRTGRQWLCRSRCDFFLNLSGDAAGNFVFQCNQVGQVAFVRFSPHVLIGRAAHQLRRDADSIPGAQHRSFHNAVDSQFVRDLGQPLMRILVLHDRSTGNDLHPRDLRQVRDQRLGHAVGKILLCGIARKVLQRRHRQRFDGLQPGTTVPPPGWQAQDQHCQQHHQSGNRGGRTPKARPGTDAFRNSTFRSYRRNLRAGR